MICLFLVEYQILFILLNYFFNNHAIYFQIKKIINVFENTSILKSWNYAKITQIFFLNMNSRNPNEIGANSIFQFYTLNRWTVFSLRRDIIFRHSPCAERSNLDNSIYLHKKGNYTKKKYYIILQSKRIFERSLSLQAIGHARNTI